MEIISYIGAHWVEWLFTLCLGALTAAWRAVASKLKVEMAKNEAIADGVQSLLRESIVTNYNRYHEKGYCPIYARESLKKVFESYKKLGGNSVAEGLYHKLMEMPTEEPEEAK